MVLAHPALLPELEAMARTAAGPDAWGAWPATAEEIVAACERARARAGTPRPAWSKRQILLVAGLALLALTLPLAGIFGPVGLTQGPRPTPVDRMVRFILGLISASLALFLWRRRAVASYYKLGFWFCLAFAGLELANALL